MESQFESTNCSASLLQGKANLSFCTKTMLLMAHKMLSNTHMSSTLRISVSAEKKFNRTKIYYENILNMHSQFISNNWLWIHLSLALSILLVFR